MALATILMAITGLIALAGERFHRIGRSGSVL